MNTQLKNFENQHYPDFQTSNIYRKRSPDKEKAPVKQGLSCFHLNYLTSYRVY
jgi:hypothetical protein